MEHTMIKTRLSRATIGLAAAALAVGGIATPALAQRDPAYDAARKAGTASMMADGFAKCREGLTTIEELGRVTSED